MAGYFNICPNISLSGLSGQAGFLWGQQSDNAGLFCSVMYLNSSNQMELSGKSTTIHSTSSDNLFSVQSPSGIALLIKADDSTINNARPEMTFYGDLSVTGCIYGSVTNADSYVSAGTFDNSTNCITLTRSDNCTIDIDISNYSHSSLSGVVADQHVAHSDVSISAGTGLSGGGNIASSRTLSLSGQAASLHNLTISNSSLIAKDSNGTLVSLASSSFVDVTGDTITGDLIVEGDLTVQGTTTTLNTEVCTTSAMEITNAGTGPALVVNQTGSQPVVDFQDDCTSVLYIEDGGNVGIGTTNPNAKLTVAGVISANNAIHSGSYNSSNWNEAYNNYICNISVSGTNTKTITLTQNDGGTITTTFTDIDTIPDVYNNTVTVSAGTDLSTGGTFTLNQSADSTITISHDSITRSDTTSNASPAHSGTFTVVDSITTSSQGHITAVNTKTVTLPADNDTCYTHPTQTAITCNCSNGIVLQDITVNTLGHVTAVGACNLDDRYYTESEVDTCLSTCLSSYLLNTTDTLTGNLTVTGNVSASGLWSGGAPVCTSAYPSVYDCTVTISAGTDLSTGGSFTLNQNGGCSITLNHSTITRSDTTSNASPSHSGTFTVVDSITTSSQGHITAVNTKTVTLPSDSDTCYTHPSHTAINYNYSNGIVLQDITVNSCGHVTSVGVCNLDNRYYTETEVDTLLASYCNSAYPSNYVTNDADDTMNGTLTATGCVVTTKLIDYNNIYCCVDPSGTSNLTSVNLKGGDLLFYPDSSGDGAQFDYYAGKLYIGNCAGTSWHMTIEDGGNVGIGTTDPSYKLHVSGNSYIDATTGGNPTLLLGRYSGQPSIQAATDDGGYLIMDSQGGRAALNWYSADQVILGVGGGYVGIGITTACQKLHVSGGNILIEGGSTDSRLLSFTNSSGTTGWSIGNGVIDASHNFRIYDNTAGAARVTVDGSGNVGIGATSPGAKLDVIGLTRVYGPGGTTRADSHGIAFYQSNPDYRISFDSIGGSKGYIRYNVDSALSTHGHIFSAGDYSGTLSELMLIRGDGNVGIGTTDPSYKLEVSGNTCSSKFLAADGSNSSPSITFAADTNTGIYRENTDKLGFTTGGTHRMIIDADGRVGIGTTEHYDAATLGIKGDTINFGDDNWGKFYKHVSNLISANGTQARRAKILDVMYNTFHWQVATNFIIELYGRDFAGGLYQKWLLEVGYLASGGTSDGDTTDSSAQDYRLRLIEARGYNTHYAKLSLGAPVDSGLDVNGYDNFILPVYVDVDYYFDVVAVVTHASGKRPIPIGDSFSASTHEYKFYSSPSYTNISSFYGNTNTRVTQGLYSEGGLYGDDRVYNTTQTPQLSTITTYRVSPGGGYNRIYGRVGIGTSSNPSYMLDVRDENDNSTPLFRLYDSNVHGTILATAANELVINDSSSTFGFRVKGDTNDNLFVVDTSNERVGIGTASPSAPLEIAGAASATDTGITIKNGSATRLRLFHNDNAGASYLTSYDGVGAAQALNIRSGNKLYMSGGGGSTHVTVDTSGNVGIGTTSFVDTRATGGLHLANATGIAFQSTSSNANSRAWRIRNDDLADWGSLNFAVGTTNSDFADAATDVVMTMLRSGNVGIGLTNPTNKLQVAGNAYISSTLGMGGYIQTNSGNNQGIYIGGGGANITSVSPSTKDIVIQDLCQLRFGPSDWDWNCWAGIKYDAAYTDLIIGGPNTSAFTSNSNPPNIGVIFAGVDKVTINNCGGSDCIFVITRSGSTTAGLNLGVCADQTAVIASENSDLRLGKKCTGTFYEYSKICAATGDTYINCDLFLTGNVITGTGTYCGCLGRHPYHNGYFGLWNDDQNAAYNQGYMIINNGSITYINGSDVIIRGGNNSSGNQLCVTTAGSYIGGQEIIHRGNDHQLFNNQGSGHTTHQNMNISGTTCFGAFFMQNANTASNCAPEASQFYLMHLGLGNDYSWYDTSTGRYGAQLAFARSTGSTYLYKRSLENGSFGSWQKFKAGEADNADTLDGIQGSSFLRSDANDTFSGTLTYSGTGTALNFTSTGKVILADHSSNSTSVPFDIRKSGSSLSDSSSYGILHLSRLNHNNSATSAGASLYFQLKDSGGTLREYAGISGQKTEAGAAGGRLEFYRYGRTSLGYWDSTGLYVGSSKVWHAGNDGSGSGLDADLLDGYHQTSFVRLASSSNSPTNGFFAIGTASSRNFIQSHGGQPLDINPLGNTVTIGGTSNTAWHAGNDGSGSGLDADLLDGQQNSSFFRALAGGTGSCIDTYTDIGFRTLSYTGYSSILWSTNPGGSTGTVQMEFEYNTPVRGFKIRNKTDNTTWSNVGYVTMTTANQGHISGTIWHSANDGSGSGLDADLLDGQQGSYYSNYNCLSNKPTIPTNNNQLTNGAGYTTCTGSMSNWYWGITGSTTTISNGDTVCLVAGSNVTLSRSGNAVTINASSGGTVYNCQITFNAGTGLTTSIGANDYIELNQSFNETISYSLTTSCQTAIANGATAYGWGNHSCAGYCTTDTNCTYSLYQYSNRARLHESPSNSVWDVTFGAGTGMSVSGSGGTITYTNSCPSDYRLKTCVESYVDAYDIVKGVEAYKYVLIDDKDQKEETGLIAHELQEVLPNAVIGEKDAVNDEGEPVYQEVVYSGLVPTLWSALKTAISKIEDLENRIAILEA